MEEDSWNSLDDHGYSFNDISDSVSADSAEPFNANEADSNTDEVNAAVMGQLLPHIDPDADNLFHPSKFYKNKMKYVKPQQTYSGVLPVNLLAQINLFCSLVLTGCSLSLFEKIMGWVVHYSRKEPEENMWIKHLT